MRESVLSMGAIYLDINAINFPYGNGLVPNIEVVGGNYEIAGGGSALNFARFCIALNLDSVFIGKVGSDVIGSALAQQLKNSGVEPAFIVSDQVQTNIGINLNDSAGEAIMAVLGTANQSLSGAEVLDLIKNQSLSGSYVYLGGAFKLTSLLPFYNQIAQYARNAGAKVILDHGRVTQAVDNEKKNYVRTLAPNVDIYLPSKEEFLDLWEVSTIQEGIEKVREQSKCIIVVKDAENGAFGAIENEIIHVPAYPVQVVNSVGAGDCFNAGFIKAQTLGYDLRKSLQFACATASLKISNNTLPNTELVLDLIV